MRGRPGRGRRAVAVLLILSLLFTFAALPRNTRYRPQPRVAWRHATPPDVVVFSVSGRCGLNCNAPDDNHDYLSGAGTVREVARAFEAEQMTVYALGYRSHLFNGPSTGGDAEAQFGFLQLETDFDWVRRNWPATRKVLLGHSHGVNWTHNLLRLHPAWTADYLIDLDGVCTKWEEDNEASFRAYYRARGGNPWPADPRRSCRAVFVQGKARKYSVKDVAYPGVTFNLEVRTGAGPIADAVPNLRPDGSKRGVEGLVVDENHAAIVVPGSRALEWVVHRIACSLPAGSAPATPATPALAPPPCP